MPTQFGSPLYRGNRPNVDASLVSILPSAGALISGLFIPLFYGANLIPSAGKTTTTEFTVLNAGPNTTNPHDPDRTPGGSSAGSAAVVADYQVPLSFGTQNGGSVIRLASYTSIFAMKSTLNAVSAEGVKLVSFNIDTCGVFSRSMEDLELLADIFALGEHGSPKPASLKEARAAFVKIPIWFMAGPGTTAPMEKAAKILGKHGVQVEEIDLPSELGDAQTLKQTHRTVLNGEAQAAFLIEYWMDKTKLNPKIRGLVENASNITLKETVEATDRYATMRSTFDKFAAEYSAIITPSAVDVAPRGLGDMGDSCFNFL